MSRLHAINRLYALLDEYEGAVNGSNLTASSKKDYVSFAEMFVRWVDDDFTPGWQAGRTTKVTNIRPISSAMGE